MFSARDIHRQLSHLVEGYESEFDSEDEIQVSKMQALRREKSQICRMSEREKRRHYQRKLFGLEYALTLGFANRHCFHSSIVEVNACIVDWHIECRCIMVTVL